MNDGALEGASLGELFGRVVATLREAAGYRQAELARATYGLSSPRLNQIERGTGHPPTLANAMALDAALNTGGVLAALWKHSNHRVFLEWSQPLVDLENTSVEIHAFNDRFVPGLLQTEDYARTVLGWGRTTRNNDHLEQRVLHRLARQERLNGPDAPYLWVVLDEAVVRRRMGNPDTTRDQLARLLATARTEHITVQILPFNGGEHLHAGDSLTLLTTNDQRRYAYTEGATRGHLISDPDLVRQYTVIHERQRARALPVGMSMAMIREAMDDLDRPRTRNSAKALRLAKARSQRFGGRRTAWK
ncbi:helix-turn-helix domain-containing protein [Embleya sp. NPDC056575]|uniref:helix-turn-helix domain-containing protein n=1 Tax=unclassified Embleya TaxID=2699296 RepID=UPI0036A3BC16